MIRKNKFTLFTWKGLFRSILCYRRELVVAHIVSFMAVLISVPVPMLIPMLIDEVLLKNPAQGVSIMNGILVEKYQHPYGYILLILCIVVLMRLFSLILGIIQERTFTIIGMDVCFEIRKKVITHLSNVHIKEYEEQGTGSLSSRCLNDVNTIEQFISVTTSRFVMSSLTVVGVAAVLLWINPLLGLIILILNPTVIMFSRTFFKHVKKLKKEENKAIEIFQQSLLNALDGIKQLRVINWQNHYFDEVITKAKELKDRSVQSKWKTSALSKLSFTVFLLGYELFRCMALAMVIYSDLSIGQMFSVFAYLWFMMGPVQELLGIQNTYFSACAAIQRVNDVLELETEFIVESSVNPFHDQKKIGIEMRKVNFSYCDKISVLKDINMLMRPGEVTALVSVSGGGKSTLAQLLLGLYDKKSGEILYNGIAIEEIDSKALRENVGVVLQDPKFFSGSIINNLCHERNTPEDIVWEMLEMVELKKTIEDWPDQLNTLIGYHGIRLSGGQRQRLALARTLLSKPKILILDEATSALDPLTESKIIRKLKCHLFDKTVLIIAHRMNTIKDADTIYVLDDGQIIQSGLHRELLTQEGLYRTLYASQIKRT